MLRCVTATAAELRILISFSWKNLKGLTTAALFSWLFTQRMFTAKQEENVGINMCEGGKIAGFVSGTCQNPGENGVSLSGSFN